MTSKALLQFWPLVLSRDEDDKQSLIARVVEGGGLSLQHHRPLEAESETRNRKPAPFQSSTRHSKQTLSVLLAAAKARKLGRRHHPVSSLHVLPLYSQRPLPSVHHLYICTSANMLVCMHVPNTVIW